MAGEPPVADASPPEAFLRVFNPVMRALITSPAGRIVPVPFVVLRFTGRRTGRTYEIVVGWYDVDGAKGVFTARPWGLNFRGGAPVEVAERGHWRSGSATLIEDPEAVAAAMQRILDGGLSPRQLGLRVAPGHRITADDIRAVGRRMVQIELAGPP